MNNKGQAVLSEYVMIFFVVIAAAVAMTTFVQRGFEARVHDARNFMINAVNSVCDQNCKDAAGGKITNEYEPYYAIMDSNVQHNEKQNTGATQGNAQVLGAIYTKSLNEATITNSSSCQLPPECTNNPNLPYCVCPGLRRQ